MKKEANNNPIILALDSQSADLEVKIQELEQSKPQPNTIFIQTHGSEYYGYLQTKPYINLLGCLKIKIPTLVPLASMLDVICTKFPTVKTIFLSACHIKLADLSELSKSKFNGTIILLGTKQPTMIERFSSRQCNTESAYKYVIDALFRVEPMTILRINPEGQNYHFPKRMEEPKKLPGWLNLANIVTQPKTTKYLYSDNDFKFNPLGILKKILRETSFQKILSAAENEESKKQLANELKAKLVTEFKEKANEFINKLPEAERAELSRYFDDQLNDFQGRDILEYLKYYNEDLSPLVEKDKNGDKPEYSDIRMLFKKLEIDQIHFFMGNKYHKHSNKRATITYANGDVYQGGYTEPYYLMMQPYGQGKIIYQNGDICEIKSTTKFPEIDVSDGTVFRELDVYNGTVIYKNGDIYKGQIKVRQDWDSEPIKHGCGILHEGEGREREGIWKYNKRVQEIDGYVNPIYHTHVDLACRRKDLSKGFAR